MLHQILSVEKSGSEKAGPSPKGEHATDVFTGGGWLSIDNLKTVNGQRSVVTPAQKQCLYTIVGYLILVDSAFNIIRVRKNGFTTDICYS
jgi:hypothetical protein